ncbi:type II toxin-antitoxin system TacA family antitoxin [Paracidovorax citrulli]
MPEKKGTTAEAATEGRTADPQARGRITARLSAEKQELLQLAADVSGSTLNQFIVQAALRAAAEVIEQEEAIRAIKLNAEESRRFLALLEDPPQPNDTLKRAMERFRSSRIASADSSFEF